MEEQGAEPTNGLALEVAARRHDLLRAAPRSAEPVRLAATQRVTRAQHDLGPVTFAHFQLLGAVTGGRDTGGRAFERDSLTEHLRFAAAGLRRPGPGPGPGHLPGRGAGAGPRGGRGRAGGAAW